MVHEVKPQKHYFSMGFIFFIHNFLLYFFNQYLNDFKIIANNELESSGFKRTIFTFIVPFFSLALSLSFFNPMET